MESETVIKDKHSYKRRLDSMYYTLASLDAQILENHGELSQELKKRMKENPDLEIIQTIEKLTKDTELSELKRRLREQAIEAGKKRKEAEGKHELSLAVA